MKSRFSIIVAAVVIAGVAACADYAQSTNTGSALRLVALRAALPCDNDSDNWQAMATVRTLGPPAIRGKAAEAIAAPGPEAHSAKPALQALLNDKWEFVRDAAEGALKAIASQD